MRHIFFYISALLLVAGLNSPLNAQPQYYNNTGTGDGSNSFPFNISGGKDVQMLYLPGEFNKPAAAPAGNITSVSVYLNSGFGPATYTDLTIKLGQSAITALTPGAFYSGSLTTVYYRSSVTLTASAGSWLTFTLDTPFAYDPTQSLVFDIGHCGGTGPLGGTCAYKDLSGVRRVWSAGGCPFTPYASSSVYVYHLGITLTPTAIPTLSQWGLIILSLILVATGTIFILKRNNSPEIARQTTKTKNAKWQNGKTVLPF
jgi:hypothetical protein